MTAFWTKSGLFSIALAINCSAPRLAGGQKRSYKPLRVGFNPQGAYQILAHMKQLLVVCLLLTGCGVPHDDVSHPDFKPLTVKFEQETGIVVTVPVIYDDLDKDTVGLCEVFEDGYKLIRINTFHWERMTDGGREETMYHELGHCQLNRDHSELLTRPRGFGYSIPNSIMYPYVFGDASFYWMFREHYVQELIFPDKRLEF